ncbi:hypothetical protein E4T56_gene1861 [Termitomyces sp. T112]|nr:hypothetical protein E4T56_gene1861 [Termitomyces sp. T112]
MSSGPDFSANSTTSERGFKSLSAPPIELTTKRIVLEISNAGGSKKCGQRQRQPYIDWILKTEYCTYTHARV